MNRYRLQARVIEIGHKATQSTLGWGKGQKTEQSGRDGSSIGLSQGHCGQQACMQKGSEQYYPYLTSPCEWLMKDEIQHWPRNRHQGKLQKERREKNKIFFRQGVGCGINYSWYMWGRKFIVKVGRIETEAVEEMWEQVVLHTSVLNHRNYSNIMYKEDGGLPSMNHNSLQQKLEAPSSSPWYPCQSMTTAIGPGLLPGPIAKWPANGLQTDASENMETTGTCGKKRNCIPTLKELIPPPEVCLSKGTETDVIMR